MGIPAEDIDHQALLSSGATARHLGVTTRALELWRQKKIGPPWVVISRRCVRYRRSDLERWLAERTVAVNGGPPGNR